MKNQKVEKCIIENAPASVLEYIADACSATLDTEAALEIRFAQDKSRVAVSTDMARIGGYCMRYATQKIEENPEKEAYWYSLVDAALNCISYPETSCHYGKLKRCAG